MIKLVEVFSRLKSITSSNVEILSNECQANKELAMTVEKQIEFVNIFYKRLKRLKILALDSVEIAHYRIN